ncbi:histidine kinase [Zunongwangia endophytica]|uniref:Histidine kinase n=1 Tax=Zunongwangia endophytica TaxID=1808945 RepID=A0ABV8H6K5_9FLAO|nr:histidine kinase [Zunongwangia endophytica]MDN3594769.1 histidine kinase [Zunongwangia endophytica]
MASIQNNPSQLYRITYEAYSKFANAINRCSNLNEVGTVAEKHLKYILNFHLLKITIEQQNKFIEYSLSKNEIVVKNKELDDLNSLDKKLLDTGIPVRTSNIPDDLVDHRLNTGTLENPLLWAWLFDKGDHRMLISLIADDNRSFATRDIEILKLAADCFDAKFKEISLKKELAKKNNILEDALNTIKVQNNEINEINRNQKEIIRKRTNEITLKNKKLLKISVLNAHNVKEPLSRIQGIIELFDIMDDESCRNELLPMLKVSAEEMDEVVKKVIDMASKELIHLNADKK